MPLLPMHTVDHIQPTDIERVALERLLAHAQRETGQARRVADFLLAWWNPDECGRFDLRDAWNLDDEIVADIETVFGLIVHGRRYPDMLGYGSAFENLVRARRPAASPAL